jgi:hypothetical protein
MPTPDAAIHRIALRPCKLNGIDLPRRRRNLPSEWLSFEETRTASATNGAR